MRGRRAAVGVECADVWVLEQGEKMRTVSGGEWRVDVASMAATVSHHRLGSQANLLSALSLAHRVGPLCSPVIGIVSVRLVRVP